MKFHLGSNETLVMADDSPEALAEAQDALLDARSKYRLRNDAVELIMMANPVLKAVHGGTNASPIERYVDRPPAVMPACVHGRLTESDFYSDLLPYVVKRDEAAVSVAKSATETQQVRASLTNVQTETLRVCRRNVNLTSQVFDLAEQLKERKAVDWDGGDEALRVRNEKQRWRVVKGAASGIVAGSGVDWVDDEELRNMVLDPEDDD